MRPTRWEMPSAPPEDWPCAPVAAPPVPPHPPAPRRLGPRGWLLLSLLIVAGLVGAAVVASAVVPERGDEPVGDGPEAVGPLTVDLTAPRAVAGCCLVALGLDEVVGLAPDGASVRWRTPCPVPGWAGAVDGSGAEVAVVTCDDALVGLDGRGGQVLWRRPLPPSALLDVGPAVVVIRTGGSGVATVDVGTGADALVVDRVTPTDVASDADHLYVADAAGVTARDLTSGEIVWVVPQPSEALAATGSAVHARTDQHEVLRLDPATGETVARSGDMRPDLLAHSDVVAVTDEVVVLQGARPPYVTAVHDAATAELLWQDEGVAARPVAAGGGVVSLVDPTTDVMVLHDARTGDEVGRRTGVAGVNPAVLGDVVVFGSATRPGRLEVAPLP